jgi:cold shock CspA family protein
MARGRPGGWERRPKREDRPFVRPRRDPHGEPPGDRGGSPEILARLQRLESLVLAIAAHLGVEPESGGRPPRRAGPGPAPRPRPERRAAGRAEASPSGGAHAVVRTVARHLGGRLKLYHADRGYGFVTSADAPEDIFFHRSDCRADPASLEPSTPVTFDLVEMANGQFKATNLEAR